MAPAKNRLRRTFKGIWLPREIWNCKALTPTCRVLLAEINSLSNREEGCTASNTYFANFFGISVRSVSRGIALLHQMGFVVATTDKADSNKRTIFISDEPIDKLAIGTIDKMTTPLLPNCPEAIDKMASHYIEDNTVNNTGGEVAAEPPAPRDPSVPKQKKTPETKAGRAWESAREVLEDELYFPDRFLEFFDMEVMGRWNKFEVTVAVVKDWHRQLYIKYDTEMLAVILSDYSAQHKGWQPKLAEVVKLASAQYRREAAAENERKKAKLAAEQKTSDKQARITFHSRVMSMSETQVLAKFREGNPFDRALIKKYRPDVFGKKEARV